MLKSLFKLNTFIDQIDENSFKIPVINPNHTISYKFLLLNYMKICEIINTIDLIHNTFNRIRPYLPLDRNNNIEFTNHNRLFLRFFQANPMNNPGGGGTEDANIQAIINLRPAPATQPNDFFEIDIYNFLERKNIIVDDISAINLTNVKDCKISELVEKLNTINREKYTLKFIDLLNRNNANQNFYRDKYFNTLITANEKNKFIQDFAIKYKAALNGAGAAVDIPNAPLVHVVYPFIIGSINDISPDPEYDLASKNDASFKLFALTYPNPGILPAAAAIAVAPAIATAVAPVLVSTAINAVRAAIAPGAGVAAIVAAVPGAINAPAVAAAAAAAAAAATAAAATVAAVSIATAKATNATAATVAADAAAAAANFVIPAGAAVAAINIGIMINGVAGQNAFDIATAAAIAAGPVGAAQIGNAVRAAIVGLAVAPLAAAANGSAIAIRAAAFAAAAIAGATPAAVVAAVRAAAIAAGATPAILEVANAALSKELEVMIDFKPEFKNGDNYIKRDNNAKLLTPNKEPITILKKIIIKKVLQRINTFTPKYDRLITKYNPGNVDKNEYKSIVVSFINEYIDEYIDSAKVNYARKLLRGEYDLTNLDLYDMFNIPNIKDTVSTITSVDYRTSSSENYESEANNAKEQIHFYNYNSIDEKLLCYNNNIEIIKKLLDNSQTNYFDTDKEGNNILHYLVNIENYNFFMQIFKGKYKEKLQKFKNTKNKYNQSPIDLIKDKIYKNNINFYLIKKKIPDEEKLLFSMIFSSDLYTKLKNTQEVNGLIPNYIKDIFDDLFLIYNLDDVNVDIFNPLIVGLHKKVYKEMFTNNASIKKIARVKWDIRDTSNQNLDIKNELYQFIQIKHNIRKTKIKDNEYLRRFWNSIVHVITLHFTTVFYDMVYDLIEKHKDQLIGVQIPVEPDGLVGPASNVDDILREFKESIFNFDPRYVNRNLGQEIVIYLYKKKYSSEIKEDKQLLDIDGILKYKLNKIINLNSKDRKLVYDQQIEKIVLTMKALFEQIYKRIQIFLINYIKFIELQYNLQSIRNELSL